MKKIKIKYTLGRRGIIPTYAKGHKRVIYIQLINRGRYHGLY